MILFAQILEEENYGKSVDWWALGIVMYELLVGRVFDLIIFTLTDCLQPPFGPATNMERLFNNILHQPILIPPQLSGDAQSILADVRFNLCINGMISNRSCWNAISISELGAARMTPTTLSVIRSLPQSIGRSSTGATTNLHSDPSL